jgi:hypothetical protein
MKAFVLLAIILTLSSSFVHRRSTPRAHFARQWENPSSKFADDFGSVKPEQSHKGFGPPKTTVEKDNSRSEQKKKYQELKMRVKKAGGVHKIAGGGRQDDQKQSKQRSQGW